ncbi:ComEC/Rec2 family competence protein [Cellulomonas sp. zg-ZUI222]|uniref:ComEC/Rec2 family competence protein n=1 Tax=Cellulomonas wangleii TaxID=2816956 RepID=UPI001A948593|nr:ComEC/Rec2 family competence protein [Cellulomonas wangleii]MBO0921115.1 ComEC/Rec2 family competence protein [Cellulomonas wangleii]
MSTGAAGPVDLRMLPPAAAAWCAGAVVVHAPDAVARTTAVPGVVLGVAVVAALVGGGVRASRAHAADHGPATGRPRGALPALALAVVTAAVVLVAGAVGQQARAPHVLLGAAQDRTTVELTGRVSTAPRPVAGGGARFTVTASAVRVEGTWYRVRAPVDVLAPTGAVLDAVVRVRGVPAAGGAGVRTAVTLRSGRAPVVSAPPRGVRAWAAGVRDGARAVAAPLPPDVRGLLPAVTVGDTGAVPADLEVAMRAAGLAHVMAVSGAHFAIVGAIVLAGAAAARAPRLVRLGLVASAGAALLLVVGPAPSVLRAAVMGAVGLVGLLAGRRAAGPAALGTAVVALLVADPWLAADVGFALSVAATAGLVVLGSPLVERWAPRCGRPVAALLAAPVAAQLGCLPVTLAVWPTFGPWAVLANVVVAPAVAPATVLGLLAAALARVWPWAADVAGAGAGAACWWIAAVARWAAGLPGAALPWWPGVGGAVCALLVAAAAFALTLRRASAR